MKEKKLLIVGVILFILLIGSELTYTIFYYERSYQRLEICLERHDAVVATDNDCWSAQNAAAAAYSSATANHIVTYLAIFIGFLLLTTRLDKAEKRIKELEGRSDA